MREGIHRLISADPWRKTRLHDMRGNFVGADALFRDLPRVMIQAAIRESFEKYPAMPWIPYPAIRSLSRLVRPDWSVLEHGSGMSTIWWAHRVGKVLSIENNANWYQRIRKELERRSLRNVTLEHRPDESYADLSSLADQSFDIIVIDGSERCPVAMQALRLVKRPGWIYLDNTVFAKEWQEAYGDAEDLLIAYAKTNAFRVDYFTGLPPATFCANQGVLISFE